ncbi:MAG: FliA/WhiG family RNA polymerase sigma factor [Deltaproteobacteria bacterium]|nr:FliA/WhiG family RNA polymerase sigma factor [Deltaproteobacteria bacterium]
MGLPKKEIEAYEQDDVMLRNQSIVKCLPFVKNVVHRIAVHLPATVEIDDLINAGVIGLMNAMENYDHKRDNKFSTYAVFRIKGAVLSELRSRDFLSRSSRSKIRQLVRAHERLEQKLGREVTDQEIADEINIDIDEYYKIRALSNMSFVSFEEMGFSSKEEKTGIMRYLADGSIEDPSKLTGLKELKGGIASAIEELPEKERLVISLYYWDELTMKEIGAALEITESRVSQIHSQAILHLRAKLRKKGLADAHAA